jgi:hypothetical protein
VSLSNIDIPAGAVMVFHQATAPTGWTIKSDVGDTLLGLAGGSNDYNASGGTTAGTWAQPNHNHTGPNHTHTGPNHYHGTANHTLSLSQIPSHNHSGSAASGGNHYHQMKKGVSDGSDYAHLTLEATGAGAQLAGVLANTEYAGSHSHTITVGYNGSGGAHNHGNTGYGGTGSTGAGGAGATSSNATANTWRPSAAICILATKN